MLSENIQGKEYGPIGQCIYCGSNGGIEGLGEEHIIPFSLGGKTVLLAASCRSCEGITSYLDGYLARSTFWDLRAATKTQSRNKYPDLMPVEVQIADKQKTISLPSGDRPFFTHLPVWGLPKLMLGEPLTSEFGPAKAQVYWYVPPNFRKSLGVPGNERLNVIDTTRMPNLHTFARAIAKIGYCHAIMRYGLRGFRRLILPDIILGRNPYAPSFVGADLGDTPPPLPRGAMHTITFSELQRERLKLLLVSLRIFAHSGTDKHGMPIYQIIVGAPALK